MDSFRTGVDTRRELTYGYLLSKKTSASRFTHPHPHQQRQHSYPTQHTPIPFH